MSSEGGEGTSEIVDFILYMFVLGPAVEWCLKSPKVNPIRPGSIRGIALATLLLAAIAGTKLSFELVGRDPNHFCTLGVRTDATAAEIRRAYKDISLKYHPDKNPDDKSAGDKFRQAATAYEVLKDASKRTSYNKFGTNESQMGSDVASQLGTLSIFYVIWLVVGYLLTMGKASEDGRTWAFSGLLALAVYEYQTRILDADYLAPVFPSSTAHEKVELLHKLFPPFLHGARMISQVLFMDISVVNKLRLEEMHIKVDELFFMASKVPLPDACRVSLNTNNATLEDGAAIGPSTRARALSRTAAIAAEETASVLAAQGFQPLNAPPNAQRAVEPAASAAPGDAAAAGGAVDGGAAAASAAASGSDAQEALALAARNKDRLTNVAFFFFAYAAFKYVNDAGLL